MIYNNHHNIKSSYYEANKEESTLLNYQRIKIQQYLQHFLLQNGLLLKTLTFQVNDKSLNLILYYYLLNHDSTSLKTRTLKVQYKLKDLSIKNIKRFNYNYHIYRSKNRKQIQRRYFTLFDVLNLPEIKKNLPEEEKTKHFSASSFGFNNILIVKKYKDFHNKLLYRTRHVLKKHNFHEQILETISQFTKNRFHISLTFKNINRGTNLILTSTEKDFLKKKAILLKSYSRQKYFKDCLNLFIIGAKISHSSILFSSFITEHLKHLRYHKPFIAFVIKFLKIIIFSKLFVLKGIKIVISGRLNNKPRSKSSVAILGSIPTITKTNELIDYSENTCYTKNGTFGIKVWCNHSQ